MPNYILVDHEPVIEPDILKWAKWFESAQRLVKRSVATVDCKEVTVSTVFLGIDHSFGQGPPLLFETMVFGGVLDQEMDRCSTWEQAEKMHDVMSERVRLLETRALK